jgi:hypothetical protein
MTMSCSSVLLVGLQPTAASADPGFCGVKVSTQAYSGGWL